MVHTKETLKLINKAERKYSKNVHFISVAAHNRSKKVSVSTGKFGFTENKSICIVVKMGEGEYFGGMVYSAKSKKWAPTIKLKEVK